MEALRSATLEPAKFFDLSKEMGSIDVKKKADMLLLDKNPLVDISNTRTITHVISRGRTFNPKRLSLITSN